MGRLSEELGVGLERLFPLIQHGYIRVLDAKDDMESSVVARPPKEAMEWLKVMFMPLELRPYIPVSEAMQVFKITEDEIRYLAINYGVPIYNDPAFGELLSITGFLQIRHGVFAMRSPMRTDRQMMMMILGEMKNLRDLGRMRPLNYSERLEKEIERIAAMPEPERTLRATEFWKVYRDADLVTDCFERVEGSVMDSRGRRIQKKMQVMEGRLSRGWKVRKQKPQEESPRAIGTKNDAPSSVA